MLSFRVMCTSANFYESFRSEEDYARLNFVLELDLEGVRFNGDDLSVVLGRTTLYLETEQAEALKDVWEQVRLGKYLQLTLE